MINVIRTSISKAIYGHNKCVGHVLTEDLENLQDKISELVEEAYNEGQVDSYNDTGKGFEDSITNINLIKLLEFR